MHQFRATVRRPIPAMNLALLPQAPVWVLDDPAIAGSQASAIAGRLGLPFRRLNATPGLPHRPGGPGPGLVLSAGAASGMRALLLRSRHGCRVVHCATYGVPLPAAASWLPFDMTVLPLAGGTPPAAGRVVSVLGTLNVVSPGLLARARDLWAERLSHLPQPRIMLLFGGRDEQAARRLGQQVSALARARHGCVMACVLGSRAGDRRPGEALSAALSDAMHLIYHNGEPGEDPTLGFLGHADAVVAAGVDARSLSEACATTAPVFLGESGGQSREMRQLTERMLQAGQIRRLQNDLSTWPRQPLDEAGRIAKEIRDRFGKSAGQVSE